MVKYENDRRMMIGTQADTHPGAHYATTFRFNPNRLFNPLLYLRLFYIFARSPRQHVRFGISLLLIRYVAHSQGSNDQLILLK